MEDPAIAPGDSRIHILKTWPQYFDRIVDGSKTWELRKDDRDYQQGDMLFLQEWSPESGYSGRVEERIVSLCLRGDCIPDGLVVMSLVDQHAEKSLAWHRAEVQRLMELVSRLRQRDAHAAVMANWIGYGLGDEIPTKAVLGWFASKDKENAQ